MPEENALGHQLGSKPLRYLRHNSALTVQAGEGKVMDEMAKFRGRSYSSDPASTGLVTIVLAYPVVSVSGMSAFYLVELAPVSCKKLRS